MYEDYDEGEGGSSVGRKVAMGVGVVAIAAAGFFAFRAVTADDGDGGEQVAPATAASESTPAADAAGAGPDDTGDGATATTDRSEGTASDGPASETSAAGGATTTTASATTTTPTTAAPAPSTTAAAAVPAPPPPTYDTLPDGSPAWVVALFGPSSITITGQVPDQAAKERLEALAVGNAKEGQAATIDNQVTINPAVPRNVGVRVVELTSVRFPESSAEVLPEHAAELNRVVGIMNALPNITALVIGHADQRGNETANYAISEARADAVTTYLASQGIAPSRLSSRAVGEADLLSLNDDDAALQLNRRTEFVFFGLLLG